MTGPQLTVDVAAGVLDATQALTVAMSAALARAFGAGGIGAAVFCMRETARWAKVMLGSANEIAVRLARVMSGIGALLTGGFEWQPWQRDWNTASTLQGMPLVFGPPLAPPTPPAVPPVPVTVPVPVPVPVDPPVPVVVVVVVPQVPTGYLAATQAVIDAISAAVGASTPDVAGGIGAAAFCMRAIARCANVIVESTKEGAVRFAYVISAIGAPLTGGFE